MFSDIAETLSIDLSNIVTIFRTIAKLEPASDFTAIAQVSLFFKFLNAKRLPLLFLNAKRLPLQSRSSHLHNQTL